MNKQDLKRFFEWIKDGNATRIRWSKRLIISKQRLRTGIYVEQSTIHSYEMTYPQLKAFFIKWYTNND